MNWDTGLYSHVGDGRGGADDFLPAAASDVLAALDDDADLHWAVLSAPAPKLLGPICDHGGMFVRRDLAGAEPAGCLLMKGGRDQGRWWWFARTTVQDPAQGTEATREEALAAMDAVLVAAGYRLVGGPFRVVPQAPAGP